MKTIEMTEGLLNQRHKMTEQGHNDILHQRRIKELEADLQFFNDENEHLVLLVHDLYENPCYFRNHDELMFCLDEDMLFDGMSYRVDIVKMTGVAFGQLPVADD